MNTAAPSAVSIRAMKRLVILFAFVVVTFAFSRPASAGPVRITLKPTGLVSETLMVPVSVDPEVARVELLINGVVHGQRTGRSMVFAVNVGKYLRRLRMRAVGYGADGRVLGIDELTVNDPQPPFRLLLQLPPVMPESGFATLTASVTAPPNLRIDGVDFFVGEAKAGTAVRPPYETSINVDQFPDAVYARAVARARGGLEANDVVFWGDTAFEYVDVALQQIPVSAPDGLRLRAEDLTLLDNGQPREIEALIPADDQPLNVILLVDSSESMLEELPVVKEAARQFARTLIREQDRIAIVGFHQQRFWLTPFTSDLNRVSASLEELRPRGETHLYDAVIEMLYELQKMPGRRALVVLTDGVNQGGTFQLDHLVHYARYAGVPVYPVVKNAMLSRLMRLRIGGMQAKRFAQIARDSGASYFIIRSPRDLPGVYAKIARELQAQSILTFRSESSRADHWHSLLIRHRDPKLVIRSPRGYFP
jgi:VWFA-related protein